MLLRFHFLPELLFTPGDRISLGGKICFGRHLVIIRTGPIAEARSGKKLIPGGRKIQRDRVVPPPARAMGIECRRGGVVDGNGAHDAHPVALLVEVHGERTGRIAVRVDADVVVVGLYPAGERRCCRR